MTECPRTDRVLLNTSTGEVRPAGCLRVACPGCVPYLAWRRGMANATCGPERFITLTDVGPSWPVIRQRIKLLRHRLNAAGIDVEWSWTVEENPRGTGNHVHAWQRGSWVPQRRLSAMARREGMGEVVDIRRWRSQTLSAHGYAMKAITYGTKGATQQEGAERFLALNGGRLTHQSRGWWTCRTAKQQEDHAVRLWRGMRESEWTIVHAGHQAAVVAAHAGEDPHGLARVLSRPRPDRPF